MTVEFLDLSLRSELLQAIEELGYSEPTPIQTGVIPVMLDGRDVIGQAQTGTGKTAAFSLPILNNLIAGEKLPQALVMVPTRELALQVSKAMYEYGRHLNVQVVSIYGGAPYGRQISRLRKGVDVVVGTPGRLLDLLQQGDLDLSAVKTVVLDEADEMLSMGFIEDITTILEATPQERQTTLFSATMPDPIRRLADKYMHEPQSVSVKNKQMTVDAISQRYYLVNESDKMAALTRLFEMEEMTAVLIFARTRVATGELANELTVRGFPAEVLNGDLAQDARERVMSRFRQNQIKVLVATDVAARGLDIDDISHVINYDLSLDVEVYVHRIGRTGRAGKTGIAISLVTPKEMWRLHRIEQFIRQKIERRALPTIEEIQDRRDQELQERMMVWLRRGRCTRERTMIEKLAEEGHDVLEVAAAALKLARSTEKQRPIATIQEVAEEQPRHAKHKGNRREGARYERSGERPFRQSEHSTEPNGRKSSTPYSHEQGMVRLNLSAGKEQGTRPNDVVGTIAFHAEIPGRTIGAIRIQPNNTFVDVPEQFVEQVLSKSGKYQIHRQSVTIERA